MAVSVIVRLKLSDTTDTESHPLRTINFNYSEPTSKIGRGSRSGGAELYPNSGNALFDSRVMSREHAIISADFTNKQVWIEDVGSMHGTRLNGRAIKPGMRELLQEDDVLRFGAEVSRGADFFPPLEALVSFEWFTYHRDAAPPNTTSQPRNTFSSNYSDDDFEDDEDEVQIISEMAHHSSVEVVIPPAQVQTFSVPDSDNSDADSVSSYASEEDAQYEINTSPSSPAGLTDAEKRADLEKAKKAPENSDGAQITSNVRASDLFVDDCITESDFDAEEDPYYDEVDQIEQILDRDGKDGRAPSPSDAALHRLAHSSQPAPPTKICGTYPGYVSPPLPHTLSSSFLDKNGSSNLQLPGISSIGVPEPPRDIAPFNANTYSFASHYSTYPISPHYGYPTQYTPNFAPANYFNSQNSCDLHMHVKEVDDVCRPLAPGSPPGKEKETAKSPRTQIREMIRSSKRKAAFISEDEKDRVETGEASKRSTEPEFQEIPASDFYHPVSTNTETRAAIPTEAQPSNGTSSFAITSLPAVNVFEGDKTANEPPRKKVRGTCLTRPRVTQTKSNQGGSVGRYVATAVAGMAVGAIGVVWGLVSLPEDFFA